MCLNTSRTMVDDFEDAICKIGSSVEKLFQECRRVLKIMQQKLPIEGGEEMSDDKCVEICNKNECYFVDDMRCTIEKRTHMCPGPFKRGEEKEGQIIRISGVEMFTVDSDFQKKVLKRVTELSEDEEIAQATEHELGVLLSIGAIHKIEDPVCEFCEGVETFNINGKVKACPICKPKEKISCPGCQAILAKKYEIFASSEHPELIQEVVCYTCGGMVSLDPELMP